MRHILRLATAIMLLTVVCVPAHAEGGPSADELAQMIVEGNDAEHALVAAWLGKAEREELVAVFRALRQVRGQESGYKATQDRGDTRKDTKVLVSVETHILDVSRDHVASILGTQRPTRKAHSVSLSEEDAAALIARVKASPEATIVAAPRITSLDRQKSNVSILNQVSFVKDYEVEVQGEHAITADPVIGIVQEGTVLDIKPRISADKKTIDLDISSTHATLSRPIQSKTIDLKTKNAKIPEGTSEVTIQIPEIHVTKFEVAKVKVQAPGWVLVGSGETTKDKDGNELERVVLVHAEVIEGVSCSEINLVPPEFNAPRFDPPMIRRK